MITSYIIKRVNVFKGYKLDIELNLNIKHSLIRKLIELINGDYLKVRVFVKYIDNQTKATQISQLDLTLHKDGNWKIYKITWKKA